MIALKTKKAYPDVWDNSLIGIIIIIFIRNKTDSCRKAGCMNQTIRRVCFFCA